jgi:hypothetical protein
MKTMGKSKSPSVSIPAYQKPETASFYTPWGSATYKDKAFTFEMSPQEAEEQEIIKNLRKDLLKSFGLQDTQITDLMKGIETNIPTTPVAMNQQYQDLINLILPNIKTTTGIDTQTEDLKRQLLSLVGGTDNQLADMQKALLGTLGTTYDTSKWTDLLLQEALRTTRPSLEQSLIGRGLGGSSVYKEALTDLYSKLGTQAALQGIGLGQSQEQALLNKLSTLQNLKSGDIQNLLNRLTTVQNIQTAGAGLTTQEQQNLLNTLSTLQNLQTAGVNINLATGQDLVSRLLNLQNLATSQANIPLAQLATLQNILGQGTTAGQNILQLMANYNAQQQAQALQQYQATLPYLAQATAAKDYSGLGSLLGLGAGILLAPATGGLSLAKSLAYPTLGMIAGGTAGGLF